MFVKLRNYALDVKFVFKIVIDSILTSVISLPLKKAPPLLTQSDIATFYMIN